MKKLALLSLVALSLSACVTTQTGRKQLLLVSEAEENQLGLTAYEEVLKESKLSTDPEKVALVERVGRRIAQAADRPDFEWEFKLIDDDSVANAFCLPGGKIAIYTGILPLTKTEDGLAAVMGHEVAHATLRHGGERLSQSILTQLGDQALAIGLQRRDPAVVNAVRGVYGIGTQLGILMPFSRDHELEADKVGLLYMAKAGYDPEEAIRFWQRMAQAGGEQPPEFLSTHPSHANRVQRLRDALPEARQAQSPQDK